MLNYLSNLKKETGSPIEGLRFQLYNALRHLHNGYPLVMQYGPHIDFENDKHVMLLNKLKHVDFWKNAERSILKPILVVGTCFAHPVGHTLLKYGWVEPIEEHHWMPTIRHYRLTQDGAIAYKKAQTWWSETSYLGKIKACLFE